MNRHDSEGHWLSCSHWGMFWVGLSNLDTQVVDRVVSGMRQFAQSRGLGKPIVILATEFPHRFCGGIGCEWAGEMPVRHAYALHSGYEAELLEVKRRLEAWVEPGPEYTPHYDFA